MGSAPAARVEDPFGHSSAMNGVLAGLAIGALIGVAIVATGGVGAIAIGAAIATTGAAGLAGQAIGQTIEGPETGRLKVGSPDVWVNQRPATMTMIATGPCSRDSGPPRRVATGAASVFVNRQPMARVGEKMDCSATIRAGSPDVFVGGPSREIIRPEPEVPTWLTGTMTAMAIGGTIVATGGIAATYGVGAAAGSLVGGVGGGWLGGKGGSMAAGALGYGATGQAVGGALGGFVGGALGGGAGFKGGRFGEYKFAEYRGWTKSDGSTWWPVNRGFDGPAKQYTLPPGTQIDRYGYDGGTYVAPRGTPDGMRALAPGTTAKPYSAFEVVKPIDVQAGKAAPWFGEPGKGVQYELPTSVEKALADGSLRRL